MARKTVRLAPTILEALGSPRTCGSGQVFDREALGSPRTCGSGQVFDREALGSFDRVGAPFRRSTGG